MRLIMYIPRHSPLVLENALGAGDKIACKEGDHHGRKPQDKCCSENLKK